MTTTTDGAAPTEQTKAPAASLKHAIPILALLVIWFVGGFLTANLASLWGWTADSDPLRTGTMVVDRCLPNPGRLFVSQRCTGTTTFAPIDTWRADAQQYLAKRTNVTVESRADLTHQTVTITCVDTKGNKAGNDWKRSKAPAESCRPTDQLSEKPSGKARWIPLVSGLATATVGIAVCALLLRLLVSPDLKRKTLQRSRAEQPVGTSRA